MEKYEELLSIVGFGNYDVILQVFAWKTLFETQNNVPSMESFLKNPDNLPSITDKLFQIDPAFDNSSLIDGSIGPTALAKLINSFLNTKSFDLFEFIQSVNKQGFVLEKGLKEYIYSLIESDLESHNSGFNVRTGEKVISPLYIPFDDDLNFSFLLNKINYPIKFELNKTHFASKYIDFYCRNKGISCEINTTDIVSSPAYHEGLFLNKFDNTISAPSLSFDLINQPKNEDDFGRFDYAYKTPKKYVTIVEHILATTESKAVVMLPFNFLTDSSEIMQDFKDYLLEESVIEKVIYLPKNIIRKCNIAACLVVFNMNKYNTGITIIDKRKDFVYDSQKRLNILNYEKDSYLKDISFQEIKDNDYSLFFNNPDLKHFSIKSKSEYNWTTLKEIIVDKFRFPHLRSREIHDYEDCATEPINLINIIEEHGRYLHRFKYEPDGETEDTNAASEYSGHLLDSKSFFLEIDNECINNLGVAVKNKLKESIGEEVSHDQMLQPYDVLISIKGKIGTVGIIPYTKEIDLLMLKASQNFLVLRFNTKQDAVSTWFLLNSKRYQNVLENLNSSQNVPLIKVKDLLNITIPILSEEEKTNFTAQFETLYNDIIKSLEVEVKWHHYLNSILRY